MKKKYCKCEKCIHCCHSIPGIPFPTQLQDMADYLKIPLKKFLEKYCIVGWRTILRTKQDYFIYPARKGFNNTVETWSYPLNDGECSLLDKNNNCIVNPFKPYECLMEFGCKKPVKARISALKQWQKLKLTKQTKLLFDYITSKR